MKFFSAFLLVLAFSAGASAQTPFWLTTPQTDPTEFGSIALDPSESIAVPAGEWRSSISETYFNQWAGSWHTARVHTERHLERQPITEDELRYLETVFYRDPIYRVDIEGHRTDLMLARGLTKNLSLSLRVPWISIGSPNWDVIPEEFHRVVPNSPSYGRDIFPRGDTFLYVYQNGKRIERHRDQLDGNGIGDVTLSLSAQLGRHWGARQTVAFAIQPPTGKRDTLRGSGGWDSGVRWFADWQTDRHNFQLGAGFNRQDPRGSFFGEQRSNSWNVIGSADHSLGPDWSAIVRTRIDSSPLNRIINEDLGKTVVFYHLGLLRKLHGGRWLLIEIGDELVPQTGIDADWTFHVQFGSRIP